MPKWTDAQKNAIDARNSNILVSAAAGSGKTAVLVQRVINKITDPAKPVDIDKLLIVTFTNAAAAEMKSRIAKALNEIILNSQNNSNAVRQLSLLPNAKISTIDSFCINLVRENFFMLDIEQDFTILDESQAKIIEDNAIEQIVDELYQNDEQEFKTLVELLSGTKDDKGFISAIKDINKFIMVQAFPYDWLDNLAQTYNPEIEIDDSEWGRYIRDQINDSLDVIYQLIDKSLSALTPSDDLFDALNNVIQSDKALFDSLKNADTWDDLVDTANNLSFVKMTPAKGTVTAKEEIKANRKMYKDILEDDILPMLTITSNGFKSDNEYLYPNVKLISKIVKRFNMEMLNVKKEINAYTFADIEHFAIELLVSKDENGNMVQSDLAKEYEDTFDEILVDEYQDTNKAQDSLFERLSNGHNLFMVGDVKQSIYRFRLAMPQIFTAKKNLYDTYPTQNSINQTIVLDKNFRSKKGICEFTNFVFRNLMTEKVGELDYNKGEYLNNGAEFDDNDIQCAHLMIATSPQDVDADEYEAMQVAELINRKIADREQVKDGDAYRDICYSDFAILFRAASVRMPVFNRVLTQYGIPVVSNNKLNLFESNEVNILISLLRVIDNPTQDIPLLATLMSVFYGYTADEISNSKINHKSNNLYGSISDDSNFKRFTEDIDRYKKYASSMDIESFLRQIIADTSYLSVISAMGNGEQRRLNVMKLVDLARSFDNGENVGLTSFIRYVDTVISSGISVEGADVSSSTNNAVNLMTIHKSKGLEFPVCIFVGNNHQYNTDDLKSLIQLNADAGIGLKVHNEEGLYRYNSLQYNCIKNMNSISSMSENLRVLYVAITRAKEQFITFYTDKNPKRHIELLSSKIVDGKITPNVVKHISRDCDLLLLCALIHKDGDVLRELAESPITPNLEFDFDWNIQFLDDIDNLVDSNEEKANYDDELVHKIADKLSFSYERNSLSGFTSKRAASSLDEKAHGFTYFASSKPSFLNKSGMTPAQKGTAMHTFMQFCDYNNAKDNLNNEIDRLVNLAFISQEQADCLDKVRLCNLFNSDFAHRMFNSDKIYREIKVSTFVPVNELEDTEYTDKVLIQGIADCVFEENGELVLVDYKTDRVENEHELLDLYKNQVSFYRNAVSKTLGKPVKQALLYSFWLNKECIYK